MLFEELKAAERHWMAWLIHTHQQALRSLVLHRFLSWKEERALESLYLMTIAGDKMEMEEKKSGTQKRAERNEWAENLSSANLNEMVIVNIRSMWRLCMCFSCCHFYVIFLMGIFMVTVTRWTFLLLDRFKLRFFFLKVWEKNYLQI